MAKKIKYADHLWDFSADELADAIRAGETSMYELSKSGNLTPMLRRRIQENLDRGGALPPEPVVEAPQIQIPSAAQAPIDIPQSPVQEQASKDHAASAVFTPEPIIIQQEPIIVPEGPVAVQEEPIVIPEEPVVIHEEPVVVPEEPVAYQAEKAMFTDSFSIEGRIRRTEYGLSMLIIFALYGILTLLVFIFREDEFIVGLLLMISIVAAIPMIWFGLSQSTKRCHDINRSGWWQLVPFYFLLLLFQDGDPHSNDYGFPPKNYYQVNR